MDVDNTNKQLLFNAKWVKLLISVIVAILAVIVLKELKTVFLPLIFAIFLSFVFAPLNTYLLCHRIPKFIVIIFMMLIIFISLALLGLVIYTAVNSFVTEFPKYQARLIDEVKNSYGGFQEIFLRMKTLFAKLPNWFDSSQLLSSGDFSLPEMVTGTMGSFFDFSVKLFLTLIYLAFIVAGAGKLETRLRHAMSKAGKKRTFDVISDIRHQIKEFFLKKTIIGLGEAIASIIVVLIFRVDFVVMTGLLTFSLSYIPSIGTTVATLFPILICFLQYGFGWRLIGVAFFIILAQQTFANVIEPKYLGKGLNLSPIVVLISLIFWGWVWGVMGMIVAVPLTSTLNIILMGLDDKSIISAVISDI